MYTQIILGVYMLTYIQGEAKVGLQLYIHKREFTFVLFTILFSMSTVNLLLSHPVYTSQLCLLGMSRGGDTRQPQAHLVSRSRFPSSIRNQSPVKGTEEADVTAGNTQDEPGATFLLSCEKLRKNPKDEHIRDPGASLTQLPTAKLE